MMADRISPSGDDFDSRQRNEERDMIRLTNSNNIVADMISFLGPGAAPIVPRHHPPLAQFGRPSGVMVTPSTPAPPPQLGVPLFLPHHGVPQLPPQVISSHPPPRVISNLRQRLPPPHFVRPVPALNQNQSKISLEDNQERKATRLILIELSYATSKTNIINELYERKVRIRDVRMLENDTVVILEFPTIIESISFKKKNMLQNSLNMKYMAELDTPGCSDTERYRVFMDDPEPGGGTGDCDAQADVRSADTFLVITVSMELVSGTCNVRGRVGAPIKISVHCNHGQLNATVHPLAVLNESGLFQSCPTLSKIDDRVMYVGKELPDETQIFQEQLLQLLVKNLKIFGDSNLYDKCFVMFEGNFAAKSFLEFLKPCENYEAITKSFSGIIYAPEKFEDLEDLKRLDLDLFAIEVRSMAMSYLLEISLDKGLHKKWLKEKESVQNIMNSMKQILVAVVLVYESITTNFNDDNFIIRHINCYCTAPNMKKIPVRKAFSLAKEGEKKMFLDFFQHVNDIVKINKLSVTLLTFSNLVTLSLLMKKAQKLNILNQFMATFTNVCDLENINMEINKRTWSKEDGHTLYHLFGKQKQQRINKFSSPVDSFRFEDVHPFPVKLSKPCNQTINTEIVSEEFPVRVDVNKLKNRTISYTSNLSGVKVVQVEISEKSLRVTYVSNTPYEVKAGIPFAVLFLIPENKSIPTKLPFLSSKYSSLNSIRTSMTPIAEFRKVPFSSIRKRPLLIDTQQKDFEAKERQQENEPLSSFLSLGPASTSSKEDIIQRKSLQNSVESKREKTNFSVTTLNDIIQKVRSTEPTVKQEKKGEEEKDDRIPPPPVNLFIKMEPDKANLTVDEELEDLPPPPDIGMDLDEPEPELEQAHEEEIVLESVSLNTGTAVRVKTEASVSQGPAITFIHCELEAGEVTSLEALVSLAGGDRHFKRPAIETASDVIRDLLLFMDVKEPNNHQLVMMCPDTLEMFRGWMSRSSSESQTNIFDGQITTLASIVNSYERSGMFKATHFKSDRLVTYFENICEKNLSANISRAAAMKEIYSKLSVTQEDMFTMSLSEDDGPFLPVFFAADTFNNNNLLTLGYYTVDQQSFFEPITLEASLMEIETVRNLGFESTSTFKTKNKDKPIECKSEEAALSKFLDSLLIHSNQYGRKSAILIMEDASMLLLLMEKLEKHGLLKRAIKEVTGFATIEEYWEDQEFRGFKDIQSYSVTKLERSLDDFVGISSGGKAMVTLQVLSHKLGTIPTFSNFLQKYGYPVISPHVNSILQSSDAFTEDRYKVVSSSQFLFYPSSDEICKVPSKVLGIENLSQKIDLHFKCYPLFSVKKSEKINHSDHSLFLTVLRNTKVLNQYEPIGFAYTKKEKKKPVQTKNVFVEKTVIIPAKESIELYSDYILKPEKGFLDMEVEIYLDPVFGISDSPDHPLKVTFSYEKKQRTTNQRVKYVIKNLTNTEFKLRRGEKIGEAHFERCERGNPERVVKLESIRKPIKREFETVDCNQDNLCIKYPLYEKFIRTLMCKDKQIIPSKVEDVLKFCVIFIGEDELQDLIKTNYSPSRSVSDYARIIKEKSMPASFVTEDFLEVAIKAYVDILEDKKREDDNISLRSISMDTDTDQDDTSSVKSGSIKLVPLSKLKSDQDNKISSEYIEFIDDSTLMLESKVKRLDEESQNEESANEAACAWHEPVNKEKAENKKGLHLPQGSLDLLPEPCPLQPPESEMSEEEDVVIFNLPSPCASVSRTGANATVGEDTSKTPEASVERQSKSNQESKEKSRKEDTSAGEPVKEKRVRKRITMSDQSQSVEDPELTSPKRVVILKEEDLEEVSCPHFDKSDNTKQQQKTCLKCSSIRKGRARCTKVTGLRRLASEQGFCKFELIDPEGCGNPKCPRAHLIPSNLHIEPLPFCLDFLRNDCSPNCKREHLTWKEVEKTLANTFESLFDNCETCLFNFTEERDELLRKQNQSKVTKSRKRPPPKRRNTEVEREFDGDEEGPPMKKTVCKHFLEGACNYGSNCWKYHDVSGMDLRKKISRH